MRDLDDFKDLLLGEAAFLDGAIAGLAASTLSDEDPIHGFFRAVRRTTQVSLGHDLNVVVAPAIIVLSDNARLEACKLNSEAKKITDIDLKSPDQWQGKILFCAPHGSGGWAFPIEGDVDAGLQFLEESEFGKHPVVVVYPEKRMLSCYPEGAIAGSQPIRLPLPSVSKPVTIANIFHVLEEARQNSLMIPASALDLWKDGKTYTPRDQAERRVQSLVQAWLAAHFQPILVEVEQNTRIGRIDIIFINPNAVALGQRHPAVLELKVIRSKSQNGTGYSKRSNEIALAKGLRQAKTYRKVKDAKLGVLACFDMRETKDDIMAGPFCVAARERYFKDDADLDVRLFPLYGNTEDAHEEMAA